MPERIISDASLAPDHLRSLRIERFLDHANGAGVAAPLNSATSPWSGSHGPAVTALIERAIDDDIDLATAYREARGRATTSSRRLPRRSGGSTSRRTPTGPTSMTAPLSSSTAYAKPHLLDQLRALLPMLWAVP